MALKEFTYKGKTLDELKQMSIKEFSQIVPARSRRSLLKGFTQQENRLLKRIRSNKTNKPIRTHCRDMTIIPEMIDKLFLVHQGKEFVAVMVTAEMLGHYLGEFALTRKRVQHSAPGIGATRSSAAVSVK